MYRDPIDAARDRVEQLDREQFWTCMAILTIGGALVAFLIWVK